MIMTTVILQRSQHQTIANRTDKKQILVFVTITLR